MLNFSETMIYFNENNYLTDEAEQSKRIAKLEARADLLGTDIYTGGSGDIDVVQGKIRLVSGLQNLAQQLLHRLMTPKGEHPQDPYLGVDWFNYLGSNREFDSETLLAMLADDITEELSKESRIKSIGAVEVSYIDINAISVYVELIPISSEEDLFGIATNVTASKEGESD